MKIVTFPEGQGSDEWHLWRKSGIGASDISIIMGSNPYSTPLKLWEKKCGFREEEPINFAMGHGIANEGLARQWLNENRGLHLNPICVEDNEKSHYRASLDGWDFDSQTLVEIKCPVNEDIIEKARVNQSIPSYWYDQVQWQIMLTNPKHAMIAIWDYRHKSCITIDLFGITQRIQDMRKKADDFWHMVQMGRAPEAGRNDFIEIDDPKLHELLLEYRDLSQKEKALSNRKKELKALIEDYGDDGNFNAFGFKVSRVTPPTRYNWEQMRLDGVDLDRYIIKSDSIGWYRIMCPKD